MTPVETIPKATVWSYLEALGIPPGETFNRTMVVHITGDHISYELADGHTVLWRRVVDECPSCHALNGQQPHTEYCPIALARIARLGEALIAAEIDKAGDLTEPETCTSEHPCDACQAAAVGVHTHLRCPNEVRPADDPPDEITCDGRNCGGRPHA